MAQIALTGSPMRKSPVLRNSLASTWDPGAGRLRPARRRRKNSRADEILDRVGDVRNDGW